MRLETRLLPFRRNRGSERPSVYISSIHRFSEIDSRAPTVPMRMIHHKSDELVPYGNSQVAFDAFSSAGAKSHVDLGSGVELVEETAVIGISSDPAKTVHVGAAFPELSCGWEWLNRFKKQETLILIRHM
jgi:hypothetical protein